MIRSKNKNYEIDMCSGSVWSKIWIFSIPLMLSGVLQLLFNAADIVVVGRYVGSGALAAVGSTSALINLLVNIFMGFSVGANVLVARYYGAGDEKSLSDTVHTAILTSLIGGLILIVLGVSLAEPLLTLMGTPPDVIEGSALYMRIYFAGMPANLFFNFGAAILRAVGDTKRPLYFLTLAGVVNVILNLFFVVAFKMGVAGVALATIISQIISAVLILFCLIRTDRAYRLNLKKLRIQKDKLREIAKIGLPAGMQGAIFSISNVLIQSSVNSFGSVAMAGNTSASNLEGFIYTAMNAFYQAAISFTGQNMGAKKYERVGKVARSCIAFVTVIGLILGTLTLLFSRQLLGLYSSDPEVISFGVLRLNIICTTYFVCGIMDTMVGVLRGMGYSIMPMIVSLTGACGLRVLWVFIIFPLNRTLENLYTSYPISWALTAGVHLICFAIVYRKLRKKTAELNTATVS